MHVLWNQDDPITLRLAEIICDAADIPLARVSPDANLFSELTLDSLGMVAVFVGLHSLLEIPEPKTKEEAMSIDTPRKLLGYVLEHCMNGKGQRAFDVPREPPPVTGHQ